MAELAKEVGLAAFYGELTESLQQRIEIMAGFFLVLGEPVDAPTAEASQQAAPLEEPPPSVMDTGSDTASIFGMGRM